MFYNGNKQWPPADHPGDPPLAKGWRANKALTGDKNSEVNLLPGTSLGSDGFQCKVRLFAQETCCFAVPKSRAIYWRRKGEDLWFTIEQWGPAFQVLACMSNLLRFT